MTQQSDPTAIVLSGRAIIGLSGAETAGFLQGLVTNEVEAMAVGAAAHGALLTPQGKVQFDFLMLRASDDRFLLDVPETAATEFIKRLMFYRLRAKVEIALVEGVHVVSLPVGAPHALPDNSHVFADPRHQSLGMRAFLSAPDATAALTAAGYTLAPEQAYHQSRIAAGIVEAQHDFDYGAVFPHDIALDQTGGVDFHKGCFVGQEVVSRMQHRGTARRRVAHVTIEGAAPARGTALTLDGKSVGEMGSHAGGNGLAIVRLDRAASALSGGSLEAGDALLRITLPEWSDYALPDIAKGDESAA